MPIDPNMLLLKRRRTKIVATLGPASQSPEMIRKLLVAGVNVFRLNMSHGEHSFHRKTYQAIREAAKELNNPVAIMADLCGPKLRVGIFPSGCIELRKGEAVTVTTRDVEGGPNLIPSQYKPLSREVEVGHRIFLADGMLVLEVKNVEDTEISCLVLQGGVLRSRQGMNLPRIKLSVPSLTEKDRRDAALALELGVDYLALSFVRKAKDVLDLRQMINSAGKSVGIVSKIEKPEALEEIEAIVVASDGIMVARGDLGVELPAEQVPLVQTELIDTARAHNRPVIVATQMLESMIENSRPTRAEVSDVSHAVMSGADAVMLSGETAVGQYPVASVETMDRVARQSEGYLWRHGAFESITSHSDDEHLGKALPIRDAIANATSMLSRALLVRSIVVPTDSGTTARIASASRPAAPLIALTKFPSTYRRVNLCWGVIPVLVSEAELLTPAALARRVVCELELAEKGHNILLLHGFHANPKQSEPAVTVLQL